MDTQEVKRLGTSESRNKTTFTSGYKEKEAFFLWTRLTEGRPLYGEENYTRKVLQQVKAAEEDQRSIGMRTSRSGLG